MLLATPELYPARPAARPGRGAPTSPTNHVPGKHPQSEASPCPVSHALKQSPTHPTSLRRKRTPGTSNTSQVRRARWVHSLNIEKFLTEYGSRVGVAFITFPKLDTEKDTEEYK